MLLLQASRLVKPLFPELCRRPSEFRCKMNATSRTGSFPKKQQRSDQWPNEWRSKIVIAERRREEWRRTMEVFDALNWKLKCREEKRNHDGIMEFDAHAARIPCRLAFVSIFTYVGQSRLLFNIQYGNVLHIQNFTWEQDSSNTSMYSSSGRLWKTTKSCNWSFPPSATCKFWIKEHGRRYLNQ